MKITELWKFFYWPVIWGIALWPWQVSPASWIENNNLVRSVGVLFLIYGLAVHIVAGKTLKKLGHSPDNRSIWPDRLVTVGIYASMRHPQHLGLTLIPLGIALLIGTFQALLAGGWTVAAALLFILVVEEPECIQKFGNKYFKYMEKTPAFSLYPGSLIQGIGFLKGPGKAPL